MVHRSRARSSSLFLMELILAILFFSVASAVCVQFFVKSHLISRDAEALTHAVNECAGTAEILCTADRLEEGLQQLMQQYPEGSYPDLQEGQELPEADVSLYYDDAFMPCEAGMAEYILELHLTQGGQMLEADLEMRRNEEGQAEDAPLYRLQTKHHIARRTDGYER